MSLINLFNMFSFNGKTRQWEQAIPPNLASNIRMDMDGGETVKDAITRLEECAATPGEKGEKGDAGTAATITVGTVTTGAAGSSAAVTNAGTSSAAKFNFTIPKGDTGAAGATGATGAAATITVGTVTTGAAGSSAAVTNAGTSSAAKLNFTIPKGDKGDKGDNAAAGNPSFDSLYFRNGLSGTASVDTATVTETVKITTSGATLAVRTTTGLDGTTATIKTQFYAQTFTLDGATVTTVAATDTKTLNLSTFAW